MSASAPGITKSRLTQYFESDFLEEEYVVYHFELSRRRSVFVFFFSALAYALWGASDYVRYPDKVKVILPLRFVVVAMALFTAMVGLLFRSRAVAHIWQLLISFMVFLALMVTIGVGVAQDPVLNTADTTGYAILLAGGIILLRMRWLYGFVCNNLFIVVWGSVMLGVGSGKNGEKLSLLLTKIAVVAVAHCVFQLALYENERTERREFLRGTLLRCDVAFANMENEKLRAVIDELKEGSLSHREVDLDAPVEKMIQVLKELEQAHSSNAALKSQIKWMINLLNSNVDIYTPDLGAQVAAGKTKLDSSTTGWLLAHTTGLNASDGGSKHRELKKGLTPKPSERLDGLSSPEPSRPNLAALGSLGNAGEGLKKADRDLFKSTLSTWNFDIFRLEGLMPKGHLPYIANMALEALGLVTHFNLNSAKLGVYLQTIEDTYWKDIAYHNATHGTDVVQATYFFLTAGGEMSKYFEPHDLLAVLLGAAVHDVDHPGVNNNFEIAVRSQKALLYNDKSPLEMHHISRASFLLQDKDKNIFENTDPKDVLEIRRAMIDCVLATDLKEHFAIVSQFKNMVKSRPYDKSNKEDRTLLLKATIKCADVSNPTKSKEVMDKWTNRFLEETFKQGDKERELKIPISAFMDRHNTNVPKLEVGFVDFLVRPLYAVFDEFHGSKGPIHDVIIKQLEDNYQLWKQRLVEYEQQQQAQQALPNKPH